MNYPWLLGGSMSLSNKIYACGKTGLISFIRVLRLFGFGIWQVNVAEFVVKVKYNSVSDNFCVWLSATIIASDISCSL